MSASPHRDLHANENMDARTDRKHGKETVEGRVEESQEVLRCHQTAKQDGDVRGGFSGLGTSSSRPSSASRLATKCFTMISSMVLHVVRIEPHVVFSYIHEGCSTLAVALDQPFNTHVLGELGSTGDALDLAGDVRVQRIQCRLDTLYGAQAAV